MRPKEFREQYRSGILKGGEVAAHLATVVSKSLQKRGIPLTESEAIALEVMDDVRTEFGGQNIYFPMDKIGKISQRDQEIFDRFNRQELTIPEIAQEYSVSIQWAYNILRNIRKKRKAERDAQLQAEKDKNQERWKREN